MIVTINFITIYYFLVQVLIVYIYIQQHHHSDISLGHDTSSVGKNFKQVKSYIYKIIVTLTVVITFYIYIYIYL